MRSLGASLACVLALTTVGCAGPGKSAPAPVPPPSSEVADVPAARGSSTDGGPDSTKVPGRRSPATDVLAWWDAAHSRAWEQDDAAALQRLYTRGSATGRADVDLLRLWRDHGLRATGLRQQRLSLRVLDRTATWLRVRLVDRIAAGTISVVSAAPTADGSTPRVLGPVPHQAAGEHDVTLRWQRGTWRVARVTDRG